MLLANKVSILPKVGNFVHCIFIVKNSSLFHVGNFVHCIFTVKNSSYIAIKY